MSPMLDAALFYARQGWAVLPLQPRGKTPRTEHGVHNATTEEETIVSWWSKWPDANVGVATGERSHLVVVDVDGRKGKRSLADLVRRIGVELPETLIAQTGKGQHFYFVKTAGPFPRCSAGKLGPGIDVRSDGGYVVAPPSIHQNGRPYAWLTRIEPVELTSWLESELFGSGDVGNSSAAGGPPMRIPQGRRNSTLTSRAGAMRRRGLALEEIEPTLLADNTAACDPPLDASEVSRIARSVSRYPPNAEASPGPRPEVTVSAGDVPNEVRRVILTKDVHGFDKRRQVEELVRNELNRRGQFFRTADGRAFYFANDERQLLDVELPQFRRLAASISGLSATEHFLLFAIDVLQTSALRSARLTEVHSFAHYDVRTGTVVVSDGGSGAWLRELGGAWRQIRNGDNDVFFLTDSESTPWFPEFGTPLALEDSWLSRFLLAADQGLSPNDGQRLIELWLCHQFFPPLRRTRIIPCFLGGQGSGKTTAMRLIGRLLLGPNFEVTGVQRDKEDAFVAAATGRTVLALDNVDSKVPWLADALALYATGQRHRMRKLYTTNEEVSYQSRAILMLSSRDPRFNRPDVTERLLPLHFNRPALYRSEEEIFNDLDGRRGQIIGSLLTKIAKVADALATTKPVPVPHRMADFASFGARVSTGADGDDFLERLSRLEVQQTGFAADNDGLILALQRVLEAGEITDLPVAELFKRCAHVAEDLGLAMPRSTQAFGRQLSSLKRVIELELGVSFSERRGHGRQRSVWITKTRDR